MCAQLSVCLFSFCLFIIVLRTKKNNDVDIILCIIFCLCRSILPGLRACATDDDVAMHLIKHTEDFEKYLHYMVGEAQAEACITDKATQQYFTVFMNPVCILI